MTKSYQLVAWTDKGQVKMLPCEVNALISESQAKIDRLIDGIRFNTYYEVSDILEVCGAYEQLGISLLNLSKIDEAFRQFAKAAECCCTCGNNWEDFEDYESLCPPLREEFYAMYDRCKNLVRQYPQLRHAWNESGLSDYLSWVKQKNRWLKAEYGCSGL